MRHRFPLNDGGENAKNISKNLGKIFVFVFRHCSGPGPEVIEQSDPIAHVFFICRPSWMPLYVLTLLDLRMAPFGSTLDDMRYIRTRTIVLEPFWQPTRRRFKWKIETSRLDDRVLGPQADDAATCDTSTQPRRTAALLLWSEVTRRLSSDQADISSHDHRKHP